MDVMVAKHIQTWSEGSGKVVTRSMADRLAGEGRAEGIVRLRAGLLDSPSEERRIAVITTGWKVPCRTNLVKPSISIFLLGCRWASDQYVIDFF